MYCVLYLYCLYNFIRSQLRVGGEATMRNVLEKEGAVSNNLKRRLKLLKIYLFLIEKLVVA